MPSNSSALAQRAREIADRAFDEGREMTPSERGRAEAFIERAKEAAELESNLKALDGESYFHGGAEPPDVTASNGGPGDIFVRSEGYKRISDPTTRGANWSSGGVEVPMSTKGTLTSSPGTALTPAGYVPGIRETLTQPLTVADLFPQPQAPASIVRYVSENVATNAAAAVAEGGLKPESTLGFTEVSEPVRKIATFLPVSDEMLEDAPQISAYLNARLALFVRIQEEVQLLTGNGTAPNLTGIVGTTRAIGTYARGTVDDNATALFKAMNGTRGSSFLSPDAIVIHPTNWQAIRLAKDVSGQFYGGGPFLGSYGNAAQSSANQFTADSLWNVRVVVTSAMTVGSALVGNFSQGGAIYRKGGLVVESSNSHSTYFQTNLVAIRAEERLALAIFRNSAFTCVTGLS